MAQRADDIDLFTLRIQMAEARLETLRAQLKAQVKTIDDDDPEYETMIIMELLEKLKAQRRYLNALYEVARLVEERSEDDGL